MELATGKNLPQSRKQFTTQVSGNYLYAIVCQQCFHSNFFGFQSTEINMKYLVL